MLLVSIFLLTQTVKIKKFLERYAIHQIVFKGILTVGYLFVFIAVMHLIEEMFEWYGYATLGLVAGALWHGITLVVLAVISYSFYRYRKTLSSAEDVQEQIFK